MSVTAVTPLNGQNYIRLDGGYLVLLRHKFARWSFMTGLAQHGHRGIFRSSATVSLRRMVGIELGKCRSGRMGGASGTVTVGNGRLRAASGGTVS